MKQKFFLFYDARSRNGYYLTRSNVRQELNITGNNERYYYRDDFLFLGWIINE